MSYYILYYPGSCGMFLTAVLGMSLRLSKNTPISKTGHCHDLGNGIYADATDINLVGWHWSKAQNKPARIFNGHHTNLSQVKQDYPDCKIVLIDVANEEITTMTHLRFYKTMNPMSLREYEKFVAKFNITDWPAFDEIAKQPNLVKQSITDYDAQWFKEWQQEIDNLLVDVKIPFSSLFEPGFGTVRSLLGLNIDGNIQEFVKHYQTTNLNLYKL